MSKFKFSLQSVLKLKDAQELQIKTELAAAMQQLSKLEDLHKQLMEKLDEDMAEFEQKLKNGMNACDYCMGYDYFNAVREKIRDIDGEIVKSKNVLNQVQQRLQEVYIEKKTLENLRKSQLEEYQKQENIKQSKAIEDILMPKMSGESQADIA